MEVHYSDRFEREYRKLSLSLKEKAEKQEALFRKNPFDVRLKTHKLQGKLKDRWSFSVDRRYRILFRLMEKDVALFIDIGDHRIYQ